MSQSFTLTAFIWALVSWLLMVQLGTSTPEEDARNYKKKLPNPPNIGAYRCREDTTVTKAVNTSHLSTKKVLKYEFCWKLPHLRCPKYKDEHVTIYKIKNVTRKVATYDCCPGYKGPFDESLPCEPVCEQKCAHGTCVKPDTCSCDPGFSGVQCQEVGCDNGNWGPDCSQPCPCENDGTCEPNTGVCQCNSGYKGVHCQKECPEGRYGLGCEKKCDCGIGTTCHHVTGDCISCTQGFWGEGCASECSCDQNGTALCFHTNGNCFCKSNFYGRRCELFCPFGYLDGVCQSESFNNGSCA